MKSQLNKSLLLLPVLLKYPAGKGTEPASGSREIKLFVNEKLMVICHNIYQISPIWWNVA
jgi:hypothetical protein